MFSEYFLKVKQQQFKKQEWLYQTKYNMKNLGVGGVGNKTKPPKPVNNVTQLSYHYKSLFLHLFLPSIKLCCLFKTLWQESGQLGHD